jgi:hypothetical protein
MGLSLHDVLKNGYSNNVKKQKKAFEKDGYVYDNKLSNRHEQVYFNNTNGKLLFNVNGTNAWDPRDLITDVYLGLGKIKSTSRYKEAEHVLDEARNKYKPKETTLTGHSMASTIVQGIGSKSDNIVSLDGGYTIGQKTRGKHYRTEGDVVSLLGANGKHTTTLKNPNWKTGLMPLDALYAHSVDNIKDSKIFI